MNVKAHKTTDAELARRYVACTLEVEEQKKKLELASKNLNAAETQLLNARDRLLKITPIDRVFVLKNLNVVVHILERNEDGVRVVPTIICQTYEEA